MNSTPTGTQAKYRQWVGRPVPQQERDGCLCPESYRRCIENEIVGTLLRTPQECSRAVAKRRVDELLEAPGLRR